MLCAVLNRSRIYIALVAILSTPVIYSQSHQQPRFEVASVKLAGDTFSIRPQLSPGRFVWTTQLAYLIGYAYSLEHNRVSGDRLGTVYTINAACEPNTTEDELRRMVQSLLEDRFNMRFHRQAKEVDGVAIVVGKGGIKIKESNNDGEFGSHLSGSLGSSVPVKESYVSAIVTSPGITSIKAHEASLTQLALTLERVLGRPFWDQTGLRGKYNFAFSFAQGVDADPQTGAPGLPTALQEGLGLALRKQRGMLETLMIDHIDPPSDN